MKDRRLQIKEALESMTHAQRHRDFQWLAVQVAKTKWPEMEATQEQNDGGEDATSFFSGSDGKRRYCACSLTGTLVKVKKDAARLKDRNIQLDVLVFVTPIPVTNLEISDWREAVQKEFNHELHVIPQAELITVLEQPKNAWLCRERLNLDFLDEPQLAELEALARHAAAESLKGWKAEYHYDRNNPIELGYVQEAPVTDRSAASSIQTKQLSLNQVSNMLGPGGHATLIGQPGAGKTFTLIQLTDLRLQNATSPVPILVSLPGWAFFGGDFLLYLTHQLAAYGLTSDALAKLSIAGRVTFLLNGWNEIPEAFVDKANAQLRAFILNNPAVSLILSTRENRVPTPLSSASVIHVKPLSPPQKKDIIKKCGLADSSALIRELETNVALAEVTDTPLFLSALINLARAGEPLPATRSGILKSFIQQSEGRSEHSAALNAPPCVGFHRIYLNHIAEAMTQAGAITLNFDDLIAVVANCSKTLQSDGHLASVPHSPAVVDCLVKHHLLVVSRSLGGAYRFVHQQFQEWFAADSLFRRVVGLAKNEQPDDVFNFQRDILNHTRWQQPLSFLLERLAETGAGQFALAAKLIRWTMPVDLHFASMLAGVAGEQVWPLIRDDLAGSLRKWYERGKGRDRNCALAAMLATGAPDFHDILWPLLESDDQQVRLWTCRAWPPFPLTCLGTEWRRRFDKWDSQRRTEFVHEMGWQPNQEHIALACALAKSDDSLEVRLACLRLLKDVGANEAFAEIVDSPSFGKWANTLPDEALPRLPNRCIGPFIPRLKAALANMLAFDARGAVIAVLRNTDDPDWLNLAKAEIRRIQEAPGVELRPNNHLLVSMQSKPQLPNAAPHIAGYLKAIYEVEPNWVKEWLADQLTSGQLWWEPFTEYLANMSEVALKRISEDALDSKLDVNILRRNAAVLGHSVSPVTAKALITEYLSFNALKSTNSQAPGYNRGDALKAGIHAIPITLLADTIIQEAKDINQVDALYALLQPLMPSSPLNLSLRVRLSADQKASLRALVFRLEEMTHAHSKKDPWLRAHLAAFLGVIGTPADAKILKKWIEEESQRRAAEDAEWQAKVQAWETGGRRTRFPGGRCITNYSNWYQGALVQLGCPEAAEVCLDLLSIPEWLGDAAGGLFYLNQAEFSESNSPFANRPKYDEVYERRRIWETSGKTLNGAVKLHADAIFDAIQHFLPELEQAGSKFPKQQLVGAVGALAGLSDARAIPILLKLSADKHFHWHIVAAFHSLAHRGVSIPGNEVASALEPFIAEHEKRSWGSNDNFHAVVQCLAILLFSDNPSLGVERIRRLPLERLKSYHMREIFGLLGSCHSPEAARLLVELADSAEIGQHCPYELLAALSANVNPDARHGLVKLLDQACSGALPRGHDTAPPLAKSIAQAAKSDSTIWEHIKLRCSTATSKVQREILSHILYEIGSADAALTLCELIHDEFPINYYMGKLIENTATNAIPAGGGAYYLKPRAATTLKKRLIGLAINDKTRRKSALELLAVIAQCRLERGFPADEAFHPDIETIKERVIPWQLLD